MIARPAALVLLTLPAAAQTPKVLILGIDGLRPDALLVADTPSLDELMTDGAWSMKAQVGPNTVSGPGWSNMLCGVWSDKHGVTNNSFSGANYGQYPDFFVHLEASLADVETAAQVTWSPLATTLIQGADHLFFHDYTNNGDAFAVLDAIDRLTNYDPDAMFTYFADVDVAGHTWGFSPSVPQYLAEIEQVDSQIGQILAALRSRATFAQEDWLILVSTDHGGTGTGHGSNIPLHRTIPFIASGPSTEKGELAPVPHVVDVAVTAIAHLGVALEPTWELDGRVVGIAESTVYGANLLFDGNADYSTGNSDYTPDRGVSGWKDIGALTAIEWGAPGGFPDATDPGPPDRGASFFSGGAGQSNDFMTQVVDVYDVASHVDLGVVELELSGWLGGYAEQEDRMSLEAEFLSVSNLPLGAATIGPVTLADRQNEIGGTGEQLTGLVERHATGTLPVGTRRVLFTLLAEHFDGSGTDGYADSLSFALTLADTFDCNLNGTPDAMDVATGTSPDVNGNGIPDECEGTDTTYCSTTPNSVGPGALISYLGSTQVSAGSFTLVAVDCPVSEFGLFYYGPQPAYVPAGNGFRCVGGALFRLPVVQSDFIGTAVRGVDLASPPHPAAQITGGSTWYFQYWYRDPGAGGAGYDFTQGLSVTFVP